MVCGGEDRPGIAGRESMCQLEVVIETLQALPIQLEGVVNSIGCYYGWDDKWYKPK